MDPFLFHRGGVGESGQADAGAKVGEKAEVLAQGKQRPAFRLDVGWQSLPFRAADRTKENGVGFFRSLDGVFGQWMPGFIDGGTADQMHAAGNGEIEFGFSGFENANGFGHHFRANAVAGEDRDAVSA